MNVRQNVELRELVDQLTKPHETVVEHMGRVVNLRQDPPLLTALKDATTSNIGHGSGSSGNAAHTRSVLNIQASSTYTKIQRQIRAWAIAVEVPRHWALTGGHPIDWTDSVELLRAWHTKTLADSTFNEAPYVRTLEGWIHEIRDIAIDPPHRWTLDASCPHCGQRRALDADGHAIDALTITEREPADASQALCRACGAVWNGIAGARELRTLIDQHGMSA